VTFPFLALGFLALIITFFVWQEICIFLFNWFTDWRSK
jgi:hypothetical protein